MAPPPGNDHLRNPRPRVYPQIASLKKKKTEEKKQNVYRLHGRTNIF